MKLSIIIVNYNVRYFLHLCLSSVQKAIVNLDAEIIVIDNNSSDNSVDHIKQQFPKVKLIENKENEGFSKANNKAIRLAKGEYICILNPDTVVAEDTFLKVLSFSENKSNLGIIGVKLIDGKGYFLPESKRNLPVIKVALKKQIGRSNEYYANQLDENETGQVPILVGAFMFMKKQVFEQVEGFDEDYFMYGEDIDLSYKCMKAGFDNFYYAETTVIHFKGESTLKDVSYAKRFYNAMQIFYIKHFKRNALYDLLIWIGVKLAYVMHSEDKIEPPLITNHVLISNSEYKYLHQSLNKPLEVKTELKTVVENTEIILDANYLTYKTIIEIIGSNKINKESTFKILPINSSYIIGSHSSKSRGEILEFIT